MLMISQEALKRIIDSAKVLEQTLLLKLDSFSLPRLFGVVFFFFCFVFLRLLKFNVMSELNQGLAAL